MTDIEYMLCTMIVRSKHHSDKLLHGPNTPNNDSATPYGYWLGVYATAKTIAERMGIPDLQRELQKVAMDQAREARELAEYPIEYDA